MSTHNCDESVMLRNGEGSALAIVVMAQGAGNSGTRSSYLKYEYCDINDNNTFPMGLSVLRAPSLREINQITQS